MKPLTNIEPWESVSKRAYWDRDVALDKWQSMVSAGHRSYLPGAVDVMDVSEFVHFYGKQKFTADWPRFRAQPPDNIARKAYVYDIVWSQLAGGGWNLRPFSDFADMPERRRQLLVAVAHTPGRSIYQVAKSLNMQYRRAHDHAVHLMQVGKIRGKQTVTAGRRMTKLYPGYEGGSKAE